MSNMGTPENGYLKYAAPEVKEPERKPMTIREAVKQYGDHWRLLFPGTVFCRREFMETQTFDWWEGRAMEQMERGKLSRIKVWDIKQGERSSATPETGR